jgi:tetratricopeptide (TPR) repeat protein
VKRPRVSLCLIAKNEEAVLPGCLESAADLVDEIVLVDTGSADRTKEVAARSGARIHEFPWVGDFAAARNESIRHATGDWIFWLDCDDRIDEAERSKLRSLFVELGDENSAYAMKSVSATGSPTAVQVVLEHVRLFPNHPDIRWQYRVHEQITPALARRGCDLKQTDVVIEHRGYRERNLHAGKLERNLRLLRLDYADHPDDPNVLFHLGWTYQAMNRPADALPLLSRCLQVSAPLQLTTSTVYTVLALCHRQLGQVEQAFAVCRQGRTQFPDDPDLLSHEGALCWRFGDLQGAEQCLTRLLEILPEMKSRITVDAGPHGNTIRRNLAVIYHSQELYALAEAQWRAILATQPESVDAWMGLADAWLAEGRAEELQSALQKLNADPGRFLEAALLSARLHLAKGDFAAARRVLEEAIHRSPDAFYPRVFLCEVLWQEGADWQAAENALRDLLARDPEYAPARAKLQALLQQQGRSP